jgi:myo-inositol 2-dehydrogenase/D-chiro-inositol 1-dehydrogenase
LFYQTKGSSVSDLNIGLIGGGRIGQVHAGSINDTPGANLQWVCDPFVENAEKLAAQFGGNVTADPEAVLTAGDVDVVIVASPTPTHLDLIDRCIDRGIHVLCEKPIDLDIAKVEKLRDKANAADVHIAIGFNRRFDPQFESINTRVKSGELGNLEQLVILSRDPGPAPRAYIAVSGGIFRDMTIHDFDMARYFVPDIVEVHATGANVFSDDIKAENDFDSVSVTMKGRNGELVVIVNSRHSAYGYDQRLEAFGSDGMLFAHNVAPTTVQKYDAKGTSNGEPFIDAFLVRYAVSYRRELALFLEGIRSGKNVNPTFDDGRAALILADAATESARTGKLISVDGKL